MFKKVLVPLAVAGALFSSIGSGAIAAVVTLEQTTSYDPDSASIDFSSFDTSLGTLIDVTLDYEASGTASASATGCVTPFEDCEGDRFIEISGSGAFSGLFDRDDVFFSNAEVDGGISALLSYAGSFTPGDFSLFEGDGLSTIGFVDALSDCDGGTGSSCFGTNPFSGDGELTLTYEYEEADVSVPEPSTLGFLALGTLGAASLKRKKKAE